MASESWTITSRGGGQFGYVAWPLAAFRVLCTSENHRIWKTDGRLYFLPKVWQSRSSTRASSRTTSNQTSGRWLVEVFGYENRFACVSIYNHIVKDTFRMEFKLPWSAPMTILLQRWWEFESFYTPGTWMDLIWALADHLDKSNVITNLLNQMKTCLTDEVLSLLILVTFWDMWAAFLFALGNSLTNGKLTVMSVIALLIEVRKKTVLLFSIVEIVATF